jgi:hypothetical protein
MNSTVRYGIAAVAVLAVALLGVNFLTPGGLGGPGPTASPTSEVSPTPDPTVPPTAACVDLNPNETSLAVDRYCVDVGTASPVEVTFDIPNTGWEPYVPASELAALINGYGWGLGFFEIDNVFADVCNTDAGLLDPPVGPTPDDLLAALGEQPAYEITDPEEVTVGGHAGLQVDISASYEGLDCTADDTNWGETRSGYGPYESMNPTPDRPVRLWVGEVDGTRLVMVRPLSPLPSLGEWAAGVRDPNRHAADLLELEAIVESLRFND